MMSLSQNSDAIRSIRWPKTGNAFVLPNLVSEPLRQHQSMIKADTTGRYDLHRNTSTCQPMAINPAVERSIIWPGL